MKSKPTPPVANQTKNSRRQFVKQAALAVGGFMIVPRYVLGGKNYQAPSDKLNIAIVGAGGRGRGVLEGCTSFNRDTKAYQENVVAICDVDSVRAKESFNNFPNALRYQDYREMLDKSGKDIDAVIVATPDHVHAVAALSAMQLHKHVYVEKPLTHTVAEARKLTEAAVQYGIVTQMGNQGNSSEDIRRICEWIWAGTIGDVREVHVWTNRPVWPQGLVRPTESVKIPKTLNWDLWLGPAPQRPYHPTYVPFSWRGWWDFGTGALGDMACHLIDPAVMALKLGYPTSVEAFATTQFNDWKQINNLESTPIASVIHYEFPARGEMPPVKMHWYDGGMMPQRPDELLPNEQMGDSSGGVLFIGDKGKIMCGTYSANPKLLPTSKMEGFVEPAKVIPRVEGNHQTSWVNACKGGPAPSAGFDYSGKLTEIVLMGNLAIRSFFLQEDKPNAITGTTGYTGRRKLMWDGPSMRITNYDLANQFVTKTYRAGFELKG